ncbi:hypothetical protein NSQ09_00755 [Bacillus sp. FSL W8-1202]|uniref:hypothetical protein n=1 Tax=Bacillus sp. FSL W8-1202 TaxID=2954649 RepID=UPI0030FC68D8
MPKSPVVPVIEKRHPEWKRRFYSNISYEFSVILGDRFDSIEDFRAAFDGLRSDLNDYRGVLDMILEKEVPGGELTWRDFKWIRANRWKQCPVCGRIYLDYTNGRAVTCYLDEYLRFNLQTREYYDNVDYRGKVKSMCSEKYRAWRKRGRQGPLGYIAFKGGGFAS